MRLMLERLYNMQAELDDEIVKNSGVDPHDPITHFKRLIALQVELAEFTNEVRFFKYWSKNQSPSVKSLPEYVDALHFFLSLINLYDYRDIEVSYPNDEELFDAHAISLTEMFALLFKFMGKMYDDPRMLGYVFMSFLDIGFMLGYKWEDVVAEYEKKYRENQERQASGY